MIHSLKLYDEEVFEFEELDKTKRKKIIREKKMKKEYM